MGRNSVGASISVCISFPAAATVFLYFQQQFQHAQNTFKLPKLYLFVDGIQVQATVACFPVNRLGVSFMAEAEIASESKGKEQPIKASEIDPKFKYELQKIHGSEKILKCFQIIN